MNSEVSNIHKRPCRFCKIKSRNEHCSCQCDIKRNLWEEQMEKMMEKKNKMKKDDIKRITGNKKKFLKQEKQKTSDKMKKNSQNVMI